MHRPKIRTQLSHLARSAFRIVAAAILALSADRISSAQIADGTAAETWELVRVRIEHAHPEALEERLLAAGFDVLHGSVTGGSIDIIVSPFELRELQRFGLDPVIVEIGRPLREILGDEPGADGGYLDLAGVIAAMEAAAAAYPHICEFVDLTARYNTPPTFEGRRLYALKISDNPLQDEDEPAALVVSNFHAREIVTPVIALHAVDRITTGYGVDPQITAVVDSNEIWIAPNWNPDGYHHVWEVNNMWRKNRRVFKGGVGVDLNRNYPIGWDAPCSGSSFVNSETYKGPAPMSEAETETMLAWSADRRFAKILDYHSSGREALYSYRCLADPFVDYREGDAEELSIVSGYGGRRRPPSADGEHYQSQIAMTGTHAYLIETHDQFQPTYESALAEALQLFPGIMWMLESEIPLRGRVTDANTGEGIEASVRLLGIDFVNGEISAANARFGRYHLFAPGGLYDVEFGAEGYISEIRSVEIQNGSSTELDVALAPRMFEFEFPNGLPDYINSRGDQLLIHIVETTPGGYVSSSGELHIENGGAWEPAPLVETPLGHVAFFPATDCGAGVRWYVSGMNSAGGVVTSPAAAPFETYRGVSGLGQQVSFADDFENDLGWSAENLGATSGDWERGVPVNDPAWEYDPASDGDGSGQCWLTENSFGNTDLDGGAVRLTSPLLDLGAGGVTIRYFYYLFITRSGAEDRLLVEISANDLAGPWTPIAAHDESGGLDWREAVITQDDLDAAGVAPTSTMRLRFTANDADRQSVVEAGLDGVEALTVECEAFPRLDIANFVAGQIATYSVTDATPGGMSWLAYSVTGYGSTPVPPLGVTLEIAGATQAGSAMRADGNGAVEWRLPTPPGSRGRAVYFQALQSGRISNVVRAVVE